MIEGLISGHLVGLAETRQGKNGSNFTLAKVKASTSETDHIIVNVITFSTEASNALLALDDGDALAVSGSLTPKVWTDKQGNARAALDMIATKIITIE
jgi:single-stranded DNA-binding protein